MRTGSSGSAAVVLRKGAWTEEEDILLRKCVEKYGEGKWHQVPFKAGLNRCRKSCRLRWLNYLRPNINRGKFNSDEDDLILRLHKLLGNRWSLIAGRLPGRTANDIKNYWNSHLQKKLNGSSKNKNKKNNKSQKIKKAMITNNNIIKPQPRTFSKNAPWLRAKQVIHNPSPATAQDSAAPKSQSMAAQDSADMMTWLDNLLNDEQIISNDQGAIWSFNGGSSSEINPGRDQNEDILINQENDLLDFCIDADIWAISSSPANI